MGFSNYKVINKVLITLFTMSHDPEFEPVQLFRAIWAWKGSKSQSAERLAALTMQGLNPTCATDSLRRS